VTIVDATSASLLVNVESFRVEGTDEISTTGGEVTTKKSSVSSEDCGDGKLPLLHDEQTNTAEPFVEVSNGVQLGACKLEQNLEEVSDLVAKDDSIVSLLVAFNSDVALEISAPSRKLVERRAEFEEENVRLARHQPTSVMSDDAVFIAQTVENLLRELGSRKRLELDGSRTSIERTKEIVMITPFLHCNFGLAGNHGINTTALLCDLMGDFEEVHRLLIVPRAAGVFLRPSRPRQQ